MGRFESALGDAACALMIGLTDLLASIEGAIRSSGNLAMCGGTSKDNFLQSGEGRFIEEMGYLPAMREILSDTMKNYSLAPPILQKSFFMLLTHEVTHLSQRGSVSTRLRSRTPLYDAIGKHRNRRALIMLVAALEGVSRGDRSSLPATGTAATP